MLASKVDIPPQPSEDRESIAPNKAWDQLVSPYQEFLDAVSRELLVQVETFEPEIAEHATYVISNPGKRLRPLLVGLAGGAHLGFEKPLIDVAVVIEMVHLATLVHDDILDAAEIRRNRPTLATKLGSDVTVLLGDCLFAHALRLAASFPTTKVCHAVAEATKRVCSGEILQTLNQTKNPSRPAYLRIIEMKTAELFGLACKLGALYGTPHNDHSEELRKYGLALGTAYQIYDDCLDIFGTEEVSGKSLGTDLVKEKHTLPILILLEESSETEKNQIISKLNQWDRCHTNWLMTLLTRQQVLQKSRDVVCTILSDAQACLDAMERSQSVAALYKLSDFLELKVDEMALTLAPRKKPD